MTAARLRLLARAGVCALVVGLGGCGSDDDVAPAVDSGGSDAGERDDASAPDAGGSDSGSDAGERHDAGVDAGPPTCTGPDGLYRAGSCTDLADGVLRFTPEYPLWSDGAAKERFVWLPPGTTIDATSPDRWIFPVGTRAWKTFSRDATRLETRLLEKISPEYGFSSWRARVFLWSADQDSVMETTAGAVDYLGTTHDVPPLTLCARCHGNDATDMLLGFGAIELAGATGGLSLADLNSMGLLVPTVAPADADVPGDAVTRAALGYMHANCGGCHGGDGPQAGLDLTVLVAATMPTETNAYTNAVGVAASFTRPGITGRVVPGDPDASAIAYRMATRAMADQMPPVATEVVDDTGLAAVRAWISSLAP